MIDLIAVTIFCCILTVLYRLGGNVGKLYVCILAVGSGVESFFHLLVPGRHAYTYGYFFSQLTWAYIGWEAAIRIPRFFVAWRKEEIGR